jgi:hypothetical protein
MMLEPNLSADFLPVDFPLWKDQDCAALPVLVGLLDDRDPFIRGLAARCLGYLGARANDSVCDLQRLVGDQDSFVQLAAQEALWSIEADRPTDR